MRVDGRMTHHNRIISWRQNVQRRGQPDGGSGGRTRAGYELVEFQVLSAKGQGQGRRGAYIYDSTPNTTHYWSRR